MIGYDTILETVETKVKLIYDPNVKTTPEPTQDNPDPEPVQDKTPIYPNVQIGKSKKRSFYNPVAAILLFASVPITEYEGVNKQFKYDLIQGVLITFIDGDGRSSTIKCLHYTDIAGDFFDTKDALGLDGVTMRRAKNNSQGWRAIDINRWLQLNNKSIEMVTTGVTAFEIKAKALNQQIPEKPKIKVF